MGVMATLITGVSIVHSTVCSGANQRKHQSSASLAFVRGIHRWPVNYPHKGPVTRKMFPFDDVIVRTSSISQIKHYIGVKRTFCALLLWPLDCSKAQSCQWQRHHQFTPPLLIFWGGILTYISGFCNCSTIRWHRYPYSLNPSLWKTWTRLP